MLQNEVSYQLLVIVIHRVFSVIVIHPVLSVIVIYPVLIIIIITGTIYIAPYTWALPKTRALLHTN